MSHYVNVRIKASDKSKVLLKLNNLNVSIKNIKYERDYLVFEILSSDIKKIKKYLVSYKLEILNDTGIYNIKNMMKKNIFFITSLIFGIIVFFLLSNIIVSVNVIHSNSKLRNMIYEALSEKGVSALSFKKSYDEYESIIESIKEDYKDNIEWLEIDVEGMVINVRVEERIKNETTKNYNTCHIVANKSGVIKSLEVSRGEALVKLNDYVSKGDILISGEIKMNEEVKNNVCASGLVYAEVWYKVSASVPMSELVVNRTGKMRYNLMIKDAFEEHVILRSRVGENKEVENKRLLKIFGLEFYLQKEYEIESYNKNYNEEEAMEIAKKEIYEKVSTNGSKVSNIMNEKVLKKSINNGNLDIELFLAVKEQIGVEKYYKIETDRGNDDEEHNGDNN